MQTRSGRLPDAVVLAGGSARRLGGVDKPSLYVGGVTLLDRVLLALPPCGQVVVVGPERTAAMPVTWTRESPAGSGPVAALAAGVSRVSADRVLLVAGDMPFLTSSVLALLLDSVMDDGALLVDDSGREQYLCSAWLTESLRAAVVGVGRMRDLVSSLSYARVSLPAGALPAWTDCDTPEELEAARERA